MDQETGEMSMGRIGMLEQLRQEIRRDIENLRSMRKAVEVSNGVKATPGNS